MSVIVYVENIPKIRHWKILASNNSPLNNNNVEIVRNLDINKGYDKKLAGFVKEVWKNGIKAAKNN